MEQAPDDLEADARLVERAIREPEAFGIIYERFYQMILNYTFRRTMSVSAAEELTSNTFFKALRALPKYRCDRPLQVWLYRIATNELRMHWRWRKRHPALLLEDLDATQRVLFDPGGQGGLEHHEEREQRATDFARLHEALAQLPQRYQAVLALRFFEQMTLEQIARVIDKPLGSVKSRLHRAIARLRAAVERTSDAAGGLDADREAAAQAPS